MGQLKKKLIPYSKKPECFATFKKKFFRTGQFKKKRKKEKTEENITITAGRRLTEGRVFTSRHETREIFTRVMDVGRFKFIFHGRLLLTVV